SCQIENHSTACTSSDSFRDFDSNQFAIYIIDSIYESKVSSGSVVSTKIFYSVRKLNMECVTVLRTVQYWHQIYGKLEISLAVYTNRCYPYSHIITASIARTGYLQRICTNGTIVSGSWSFAKTPPSLAYDQAATRNK